MHIAEDFLKEGYLKLRKGTAQTFFLTTAKARPSLWTCTKTHCIQDEGLQPHASRFHALTHILHFSETDRPTTLATSHTGAKSEAVKTQQVRQVQTTAETS
jgi:hypothetical protein